MSSVTCPRCGAAVAAPARFCAACGAATGPRLAAGEIVDGKYEILGKIGEGGMGEVYRARHMHLDEIRIIKVTKPDALGEGPEPKRFQQEARLAAQVRHPNVAALYDFARLTDGSFYMVWEYIDGITLEERLRRHGPMPPAQALEVARQILAGLGEIHAKSIVHRDISPDNILVRELPGGNLQAKIIDLGIAKRVAAESMQMTGTGMFLGKLKYCSPEQAGSLSGGQTVDARSDLYSFGVVLYEMLTGRAPFESQTPEGYLGKHLHETPPPLDTSRLPAAVGAPLAGVLRKALEKSREKRFRDADEFAAALSRVPSTEVETAPTEKIRTEGSSPRRVAVLVTLAVVAVAALWLWKGGRGRARVAAPAETTASAGAPPAPATAPPTAEPEASPSYSEGLPADVGVERTKPPRVSPRRGPEADDPPASSPGERLAATPAPIPAPAEAASAPSRTSPPPERAREMLRRWRSHPRERRAREAAAIATMANGFVAAHPQDPLARDIVARLPGELKDDCLAALDSTQPMLAGLNFRAWKSLNFEPSDPEFERRVAAALPRAGETRRP
ncbi:MAG TPA: serine/threonine-protein kinase [Thermoanaerobaculia bacterium]|jgi:serine/threonine-protein kinase